MYRIVLYRDCSCQHGKTPHFQISRKADTPRYTASTGAAY